ncbi:MAG: molybdopterin converting factor small subunit [Verrucomicrobiales bacterium]|jgi:molybdopterin converting factor small subunit
MTAKVLFFSLLRDLSGVEHVELEVPDDGVRVDVLLEQLYQKWPDMRAWDSKILVAAELDYVERDTLVMPGQEVAVMPPVQGG